MDQRWKTKNEREKAPASLETATSVELRPSIEWTSTPTAHILRVRIPGFTKEDVRVLIDSSGRLKVTGKKTTSEAEEFLSESFELPQDSDSDKITGWYEDDCISLIIPKKPTESISSRIGVLVDGRSRPRGGRGDGEKTNPSEKKRISWGQGFQEVLSKHGLLEKLNRNKKIIAVAVSAFALGFYMSRKLRSRA
ncbi:unnamed protein product [Spirodela intermedia]|uniref:Uncharacterized protein n=1 Tax=Spirodela intermedia TaxID=51605 RepID=A0A7I8J809_SPIIN|nr:unnamed protein product [Spirodela intermedia]CAA6666214.1 unnamed protein product [Spirodela intermedia]